MTEVLAPDTRVSARRAVTRERLMVAASTVFAEHGIPGASVEEICEAAGFTRGAFYSNFADKDQLVLALIQASVQAQYAAAEQAIATMKATTGDHSPADLVSIAITAFEEAARPGRQGILTQQELLLYAARQPTLREPPSDSPGWSSRSTSASRSSCSPRLTITWRCRRCSPASSTLTFCAFCC